jgi:hypothetical protein
MPINDVVIVLGALGTLLISVGGGLKWLLAHIDTKASAAQQVEASARRLLSDKLNDDIRILRSDIASLRSEKAVYIRRIYQLEGYIHNQPGMSIPVMDGWPPHE